MPIEEPPRIPNRDDDSQWQRRCHARSLHLPDGLGVLQLRLSTFTLAQNELPELKEARTKAGAIERN